MPFDAQEFQKLALLLVNIQPNEASRRTAISRIYYAAHLLAREKLRTKRTWEPAGHGGDHDRVIRALRPGKTRGLSEKLSELRRFREHADYHLESTESILNMHCYYCRSARTSSRTDPLVDENLWNEVKAVSDNLFPQLEKL